MIDLTILWDNINERRFKWRKEKNIEPCRLICTRAVLGPQLSTYSDGSERTKLAPLSSSVKALSFLWTASWQPALRSSSI